MLYGPQYSPREDLSLDKCPGCQMRRDLRYFCPECNLDYCEDCAKQHRHACEECGGTGVDPGSLNEPEPCQECGGEKIGEDLLHRQIAAGFARALTQFVEVSGENRCAPIAEGSGRSERGGEGGVV